MDLSPVPCLGRVLAPPRAVPWRPPPLAGSLALPRALALACGVQRLRKVQPGVDHQQAASAAMSAGRPRTLGATCLGQSSRR